MVHIAEEAEEEIAEARRRGLPTINAPMGAGGNFYIDDDGGDSVAGRTRRIRATRCPDRQSSLD